MTAQGWTPEDFAGLSDNDLEAMLDTAAEYKPRNMPFERALIAELNRREREDSYWARRKDAMETRIAMANSER